MKKKKNKRTGQIVNVVVSGVDVFNAFFYDPNNDLMTITNSTNINHRKSYPN